MKSPDTIGPAAVVSECRPSEFPKHTGNGSLNGPLPALHLSATACLRTTIHRPLVSGESPATFHVSFWCKFKGGLPKIATIDDPDQFYMELVVHRVNALLDGVATSFRTVWTWPWTVDDSTSNIRPNVWQKVEVSFVERGTTFSLVFLAHHHTGCRRNTGRTMHLDLVRTEIGKAV